MGMSSLYRYFCTLFSFLFVSVLCCMSAWCNQNHQSLYFIMTHFIEFRSRSSTAEIMVHLFIMGVPNYWSLFHFIYFRNRVQQLRILCFYLALEQHVPLLLRILKSIVFLFYGEQCHGLEQSLKRHPSASILVHLLLGHPFPNAFEHLSESFNL